MEFLLGVLVLLQAPLLILAVSLIRVEPARR